MKTEKELREKLENVKKTLADPNLKKDGEYAVALGAWRRVLKWVLDIA